MKLALIAGIGGCIGTILRYLTVKGIHLLTPLQFPFGTLTVNLTGCFIIGIIYGFTEKGYMSQEWRLFFITGICGGYTTFSAFSIETIGLMRDGQSMQAFLYIAGSVILGLLATFAAIITVNHLKTL